MICSCSANATRGSKATVLLAETLTNVEAGDCAFMGNAGTYKGLTNVTATWDT